MSIEVDRLTKKFNQQTAVNAVSFIAPKGQITGFLGPNGAGKSTTMKIASGYLGPTSGHVMVDGISSVTDAIKVKRIVGYLPEHNPLYLDMHVREFLKFIGHAYGIKGQRLKVRVNELIGLVGLERERLKKLQSLSKGYRQRVGLAQALMADPSVLILDEPTSGLDPNQIIEIRSLIRDISTDKTVILSTHIMQEVEAICDKVVIINQGNLVADESLDEVKKRVSENAFHLSFEVQIDENIFIEKGMKVDNTGKGTYTISNDDEDLRKQLMTIIADRELPMISISKSVGSLEKVFHELTQEG